MVADILRQAVDKMHIRSMCVCVRNLAELGRSLDADPERPVLVVGEVRLEDGSLTDWIIARRQTGEALDFLPVTRDDAMTSWLECRAAGAFDYVLKPFDLERLDQALRRYVLFKKRTKPDLILSQRMIDAWTCAPVQKAQQQGNQATCDRILQYASGCGKAYFSVEDAVQGTGLSSSTLRRYLAMLIADGSMESVSDYGRRGRPQNLYKRKERYAYHENTDSGDFQYGEAAGGPGDFSGCSGAGS